MPHRTESSNMNESRIAFYLRTSLSRVRELEALAKAGDTSAQLELDKAHMQAHEHDCMYLLYLDTSN